MYVTTDETCAKLSNQQEIDISDLTWEGPDTQGPEPKMATTPGSD